MTCHLFTLEGQGHILCVFFPAPCLLVLRYSHTHEEVRARGKSAAFYKWSGSRNLTCSAQARFWWRQQQIFFIRW